MVTRREFGRLALGAASSSSFAMAAERESGGAADSSVIAGVTIGMESYSLATLPHDGVVNVLIELMREMGLKRCSLHEPLIQPGQLVEAVRRGRASGAAAEMEAANEALRKWRMTVPLDYFRELRGRFEQAGLQLYRYSAGGLGARSTDAEMTRACEINRVLGSEVITTSAPHTVLRRFVPFAEKYGIRVGIQGRPDRNPVDADQVARPEDFARAVMYSPRYGIELDIGDATGAGFEIMPFVEANHARIFALNLKDRKRDRTSMPWGEGDTPVKAVLQRIRDKREPIVCYVDCDYATAAGGSRMADVKRCLAYAKAALTEPTRAS